MTIITSIVIGGLHLLLRPNTYNDGVRSTTPDCDSMPSDDDDNDIDHGDGDNYVAMPKEVTGSLGQLLVQRSGSEATKVKGMSNRFAFAKKIFDNVAKVSFCS